MQAQRSLSREVVSKGSLEFFARSGARTRFLAPLLALAVAFLIASPASAEGGAKKKDELPKSGTLSSSFTGGYGGGSVPGVWGGTDQAGEKVAPISGSVSRISGEKWRMRVYNNSKDPYSVNLAVRQISSSGSTTKFDSFSYTLKGGESQEQTIPFASGTVDARLELTSWRNLKKPSKSDAPTSESEAGNAGDHG